MARAVPAVSVVVPVLNGVVHVGAALASVRDQTITDIEVVVVDAGSTDGTGDLVAAIARDDDRVRLVGSSRRLTAPQARTLGLEQARADVVALLDHDDLMAPQRLQQQLDALRTEPDLVAVGGMLVTMDDAGVTLEPPRADRPTSPAQVRWALPFFCAALSSAMAYRREVLVGLGGFDVAHPYADDYALLVSLLRIGDVRVTPDVVGRYRRHPRQISGVSRRRQHAETALLRASVVAELTGRRPPPDVMVDLRVHADGRVSRREEALVVCHDVHRSFLDRWSPAGEDLEWIDTHYSRRVASIRAAELVEPATGPIDDEPLEPQPGATLL